jgi:penicillin-binding protein 1C
VRQAGINDLKPENYYGLELVLGGAEISMHELVTLYAALANDGIYQPLRYRQDNINRTTKRLLSPEASYLVLDMMKDTPPPGANYAGSSWQTLPVAWKTGTSSGFRDAWTVGVFGPYVLAVWIGNFNNQSNPVFVGKDIAAPLFFEIANAINVQFGRVTALQKYPDRMHLTQVEVCKVSGALPNRFCPDKEKIWFIPGKSPIKTDTIHREIAINNQTGLRACRIDQNVHFEVYEFWTSDLLKIFRRAGIQRRIPPPYDSGCTMSVKAEEGFIPQIISPQKQVKYISRIAAEKENSIPLTAVVDADVRNIYWFINETFLGKTPREKSFLWHAKPGNYVVRAVDDFGRSDARDVRVEMSMQ